MQSVVVVVINVPYRKVKDCPTGRAPAVNTIWTTTITRITNTMLLVALHPNKKSDPVREKPFATKIIIRMQDRPNVNMGKIHNGCGTHPWFLG